MIIGRVVGLGSLVGWWVDDHWSDGGLRVIGRVVGRGSFGVENFVWLNKTIQIGIDSVTSAD